MPDYDAPMDGWLTVSVGDDQITRVSVDAGETITIDMEPMEGDDGD